MSMITKKTRLALALAVALGACAGALAQQPATNSSSSMTTAPGKAVLSDVVKTTATVVGVDAGTRVITLKGPAGNTVEMVVRDPAQLANIKKGDQVQAVYTESFAVKVSAAPAKEADQPKAKEKTK